MGVLKFNKDVISKLKGDVVDSKNELSSLYKEIGTNLDLIRENWKGQKSNVILADMDQIKKINDGIVKRLEENVSFVESAIKVYEDAENTGVVSSSMKQQLVDKFPGYFSSINTDNVFKTTVNGKEYYVVNTAMDPIEYAKIVKERGLTQNYTNDGECLMISTWYAKQMSLGISSTFKDYEDLVGGGGEEFANNIWSEDLNVVKEGIFNAVSSGYPSVIRVNQTTPGKESSRHYVTVVGFTTDITDYTQINENNILVIDNAHVRNPCTLAESGKYGPRTFLKENGKYEVKVPTAEFEAVIEQARTTAFAKAKEEERKKSS